MKKKVLKIVGIVVGVILLLMILLPILFKGKIKDAVVYLANENLNAKVEIDDFGLNLFSNFPDATLSLGGVSVVGLEDFQNDTLFQAKSASVTIDLSSLFGDNYRISKIDLDNVSVYAKVLEDGRANYIEIVKSDSTETKAAEGTTDDTPFNLNLKKITIKNTNIIYQDDSTKMKVALLGWNGTVSGDFSASQTTINTSSVIDQVTFAMSGVPYLSKVKVSADASVNADMDNMKFSFIKSTLKLNELAASIDGSVAIVGEDGEGIDFDLKLNAPDTQFKEILSLVPAMYTDDFKNVKTSGTASVDAFVKGLMQDDIYPAFDVKLRVEDAMFQYPSLPKSVTGININVDVNNKQQGSLDNLVVDVSKLTFNLGGNNPFSGGVKITTPMSDPNIAAHANASIDLNIIKDVYPFEKGTELNGKVTADMKLTTAMSYIEKEQYDKIAATGNLALSNMLYKSEDMPDVQIDDAKLEFTPRYVNLPSLKVKIGRNDISANGRLENFIAYALKDQTLKGQLNLSSNYLNLNDLMSGEEVATDTVATTSDEPFILPKNINFALNASLKHVVYEKINITNLLGAITVNNGILNLNNVSANVFGGSAKIAGKYDTSDGKNAKADFSLNLNTVSFAQTFTSVETIQQLVPIFENMQGTYSMNLSFNALMGNTDQILKTLSANGNLQTSDVKIENVAVLNKLADVAKNESLRTIAPKNMNIPFTVKDGKIATKPFTFAFAETGSMTLEGTTSLEQEIDYKGTITLPKGMASDYLKNVGITVGGTFSDPSVKLDTKSLVTGAVDTAAEKLLGTSILSKSSNKDAAEQAKKIREDAQKAADKLVEVAKEQSDNLVKNAGSNKIAQATAKAGGKKLVEEAEKQAKKLIDEAEVKAKALEGEVEEATDNQ